MFYEVTLSGKKTDDNGNEKTVKELYLQNAMSFTETEARMNQFIAESQPGFTLENIAKKKTYTDVVPYVELHEDDHFYKIKVKFDAEKPFTNEIITPALNTKAAIAKVELFLSDSAVEFEVTTTTKTGILDYFNENI